jgi:hypothetical protein
MLELSISVFSRIYLVNPLRNSDAISIHEVKPLLRYEKVIYRYRDLHIATHPVLS